MKKSKKIEYIVVVVIALLFVCSLTASEVRWFKLNDPQGNFSDVSSYVAHGRLPSRVSKIIKEGKTFYVAFSPLSIDDNIWLALPSGPAAYVFDETGKMVQWSPDIGEDSLFQRQWLRSQTESSLKELKQLNFQQQIQGDPASR